MDRRLFLTGLLGVAGAAMVARVVQPERALAGVPNVGDGILDELKSSEPEFFDGGDETAEAEPVWHRGRPHRGRRRRRRRRAWRRYCRRQFFAGRWRRRCFRRRIWVYYWAW